jgi:hypothetical protein
MNEDEATELCQQDDINSQTILLMSRKARWGWRQWLLFYLFHKSAHISIELAHEHRFTIKKLVSCLKT